MSALHALDNGAHLADEELIDDGWVRSLIATPKLMRLRARDGKPYVCLALRPRVQFVLQLPEQEYHELMSVLLHDTLESGLDQLVKVGRLQVLILRLESHHLLDQL
jgi:hypothetical protein